jgi:hypothetical protein
MWVHIQSNERSALILSVVLGLLMVFVAYGRMALRPIA